ncbi:MAG: tripartite tricarboxylate transporter TctB family protein [Rhodobacteraceae bacterium]|nr:tripartite tricarboxylate transporter TctB family protein [Paracoccaceae bacterium]
MAFGVTLRKVDGDRLITSLFLVVGLGLVVMGSDLEYSDRFGPGPGFFPIWIGALLAGLSGASLAATFRRKAPSPEEAEDTSPTALTPYFEEPGAWARVCGMLAALALVGALMEILGFRITIFVFALLAPAIIGRQPVFRIVLMALLCGFFVAYAFGAWLGIQLPQSSIAFLKDIGL